jgi:hypothetical protein
MSATKAMNRSAHKATLREQDAREHKFQGNAGRETAKRHKRNAARAARLARKAEASWVISDN